ncbi:kinase-like domain-containing protein [Rhizophagus clarus]|uniref:Kinase-like domain-containing protein n=1 Tax=Rhizophagus clarus TaxID=94130 RepID=A0A8H3QSB0_9GLOM|nr:kinase-like domain-containing protein [Rhizophagus clarus]
MSDIQFNSNNTNPSVINSSNYISKAIRSFHKVNILKEIEPTTRNINNNIFDEDLSIVIDELVELIIKKFNKGVSEKILMQCVLNYINNNEIILQEIYHWLLKNQNNSNSIYLLGYFNYNGIETDLNKQKAIELYEKAAKLENKAAQINLVEIYIDKNNSLAFELSKKLAKEGYACGLNNLGYCYEAGIGASYFDDVEVFELYQKAADLGNLDAINNLGWCYHEGFGININKQKALEMFQEAADLGNVYAISSLGWCYKHGDGTDVDYHKAIELYLKAANLGYKGAQYNIAKMYEDGDGVKKDMSKAIYWYTKSAEQAYEPAQYKLGSILQSH